MQTESTESYDIEVAELERLSAMLNTSETKQESVETKQEEHEEKTTIDNNILLTNAGWSLDNINASNRSIQLTEIFENLKTIATKHIPEFEVIKKYIQTACFGEQFNLIVKKLHVFIENLDAMYPDRWDIISSDNLIAMLVYFPKLTIVNTAGNTHEMLDLYGGVTIHNSDLCFKYLRATLKQFEVNSSYQFSHGWNNSYPHNLNDTCLGSEPIPNIVAETKLSNKNVDSNIAMLVMLVESYFATENTSGTIQKLANIGKNGSYQTQYITNNTVVRDLLYYLKNIRKIPGLSLDSDLKVKCNVSNTAFQEEVLMKIASIPKCYFNSSTNQYYNSEDTNFKKSSGIENKHLLTFRHTNIIGKVIDDIDDNIPITHNTIAIHPSILEQVQQLLNQIINNISDI